ncbi:MAG: amino acid adenylation domain-containing protein, partial [Rhodococcus sp. (in: high G+C Gram-positive bacteria)]
GQSAGLTAEFTYATDLFDGSTIDALGDRFRRILGAVTAEPEVAVGDIDILEPAEWALVQWDRGVKPLRSETLVDLFDRQVARTPDAPALSADGVTLSYAQFDTRVNAMARYLVSRGVGPDTLVALALRRSANLLIGMYAVIKAGGAYVPVDPDLPQDRNDYVLETADPLLVLSTSDDDFVTDHDLETVLIDTVELRNYSERTVSDADRNAPLHFENIAYVIFTSGSTGRPKGVAVPHSAVVASLSWRQNAYGLGAEDTVLQKTPFTFDASVREFWWPLTSGARLVVAAPDAHRDPRRLIEAIVENQVTSAHFVPSMLTEVVASAKPGELASLRHVFCGGEVFTPKLAGAFRAVNAATALSNEYGPTEAAVSVSRHAVSATDLDVIPIGTAQGPVGMYVLDAHLRPVPVGVTGELYLAGVQLARGYVERPDLTVERFVADPFGGEGGRMYRTGDLVRWNRASELEYIGRSDFQVKLRGLRIELGEIESALLGDATVRQCVVIVHSHQTLGDHLVAYVVPEDGADIDTDYLAVAVASKVPRYMVPSSIIALPRMPLNTSGKIDRRALPDPVFGSGEFRTPSTVAEEIVAGVFAEVLGLERVGADDDFFDLGGNSLIATRVAARLGNAFEAQIPVRLLFEFSKVSDLAAAAERRSGSGNRPALTARTRPEHVPLSLAQRRMWFLNRFDPASATYNIPLAIRLSGDLNVPALQHAVEDLLDRHEILRTVYPEIDGIGVQKILPASDVDVDLSPIPVSENEILGRLAEFVSTGFDVTSEVPLAARLYKPAENEFVLVFVVHHIAGDGFSAGPLTRDIMLAYASRAQGTVPTWSPLAVQYADYALWQREMLGSADDASSVMAGQIRFWIETLTGAPEQLELPWDRPRPAIASHRGATHAITVDRTVHAGLTRLARERNATVFMVLHSVLAVELAALSGSTDIVIGTPVAGRGHAELDDLVGMFVNTLVLRTEIEPSVPFLELLDSVKSIDLKAFSHADIPFESLVDVLAPTRSQSRNPLFQVMLTLQNAQRTDFRLGGVRMSPVEVPLGHAMTDLQVTVHETISDANEPAGIAMAWTYATDLFDDATVGAIAQRFLRILDAVVTDAAVAVGDLPWMLPAETEKVRALGESATRELVGPITVPEWFSESVAATPDAAAVSDQNTTLTYREFSGRVNSLARYLISVGVSPDSTVAVAIGRSVDLVVSIYAVLAAGGAYVPVDPEQPSERIGYVLDITDPAVVLTTSGTEFRTDREVVVVDTVDLSGFGSEPLAGDERRGELRPENVAYVLFTSGSTGRPKGVAVTHAAVVNQLAWMQEQFDVGPSDVVLLKTPATFDASVWEFMLPLISGARLVIASHDGHRDPAYLARALVDFDITIAQFVPTVLDAVLDESTVPTPALRAVFAGGEALSSATAQRARSKFGADVHNLYGPTEVTIQATHREVNADDGLVVPIGTPVWNTHARVLDARLRPVPVGVMGELYLSGIQVARGYEGRAGLTAERFVADPAGGTGERLYRTGDLVRWNRGGELEYVGRNDSQVKLRGQRIEIGEIEAVLRGMDRIAAAAVDVRSDQLVGYIVPAGDVDATQLRGAVGEVLPSYMVPTQFVVLDSLPLNASGKLDRKALPAPELEDREFRAPVTETQRAVASVFADVLGVEQVGLDDDFFALGGNSLVATQVVSRLGAALDARVPLRSLFDAPTVETLAAGLEGQAGAGAVVPLVAQERPDQIPLSLAQQRMWFLNRFDPESAAYNIPFAIRLSGDLDIKALETAMRDVISRHEVLRTEYPEVDGVGTQTVLPAGWIPAGLEPVRVADEDELRLRVTELLTGGFDVTNAPPIRGALLRIDEGEHVLALVVHHIAADGVSIGLLARDVVIAYSARIAGQAPAWPPLEVQYADFALWQRAVLGDESDPDSLISRQLDYWTGFLADLPDALDLPTDRPRPATRDGLGARVDFTVPPEVVARVRQLAAAQHATPFMVVHTALAVLLARLSGTTDIAIGTPVAGRGERALDDLVGMFVNTLVLRTEVDPSSSFRELMTATTRADLDAFAHADVPFEKLVDRINPVRSQSFSPLFQVMLAFQNYTQSAVELPGLSLSALEFDRKSAQFDLSFTLVETPGGDGYLGQIDYATDIFDADTVDLMAERLVRLLSTTTADPDLFIGDVDVMEDAERHRILTEWNDTAVPVTDALLLDGFTTQAQRTPHAPAVVFGDDVLDYGEFDRRVDALAGYLIGRGVGPEVLVGVCMSRSPNMLVAIYAILRAGGGYLPIDPEHPLDRTAYVLETAAPLLTL